MMDKNCFDNLREQYPAILADYKLNVRYARFDLVKTLVAGLQCDIERNHAPLIQIAEMNIRSGLLDIKFAGGNEKAKGAIRMAQTLSAHLCDECGATAQPIEELEVQFVCCNEHALNCHGGMQVIWPTPEARHDALLQCYPAIFPQPFGEIAPGWLHLIEALAEALDVGLKDGSVQNVEISYIKEKFGTLSIFHNSPDDLVDGMVSLVEDFSGRVCDVCGRPGSINTKGWRATRCEAHK